jgi:hypothetical protein
MADIIPTICATGPFLIGATCDSEFSQYTCIGSSCGFEGISLSYQEANYVSVYSKKYVESISNVLGFGTPTTASSLYADACVYRPGLLARDLWKWDLSGESDYGLIEPPINEPNYDLFDSNWSAQFIVYSKGDNNSITCSSLGLERCSHQASAPRGSTYDPYVSCISKNYPKGGAGVSGASGGVGVSGASGASEHSPDENEPTYLELNELYKKTKECELLKQVNPDYLGCIYTDPYNECSCNCPNQGSKFNEYLACIKTNSTFWSTPHETPLFRSAQMGQFTNESIAITVSGFTKNRLKLGQIIKIANAENNISRENSGKWMITSITYSFEGDTNFSMDLILNRDALTENL